MGRGEGRREWEGSGPEGHGNNGRREKGGKRRMNRDKKGKKENERR